MASGQQPAHTAHLRVYTFSTLLKLAQNLDTPRQAPQWWSCHHEKESEPQVVVALPRA